MMKIFFLLRHNTFIYFGIATNSENMPNNQTEYEIMHVKTSLSNAAQKPRTLREFLVQAEFCCSAGGALSMINEVIIGENHWGSNPGAYLITNFLPYVSLPFPTPTLHHFTQKNRNVAQSTLSENFYFQHN